MYHHDKHLHTSDESSRSFRLCVVPLIPSGAGQKDRNKDSHDNPYLRHGFCYAEINGAFLCTVRHYFVYLAMLFFVELKVIWKSFLCAKSPFSCGRTAHNDREWNADMPSLIRTDMPFVSVRKVFEDYLGNVYASIALFFCRIAMRGKRKKRYQ